MAARPFSVAALHGITRVRVFVGDDLVIRAWQRDPLTTFTRVQQLLDDAAASHVRIIFSQLLLPGDGRCARRPPVLLLGCCPAGPHHPRVRRLLTREALAKRSCVGCGGRFAGSLQRRRSHGWGGWVLRAGGCAPQHQDQVGCAKLPGADGPGLLLSLKGQRLSARAVDLAVRRLGRAADVTLSAHTLRRTCLTGLVRAGHDIVLVAELAGHSRLETTRRYSLPRDAGRQAAMDCLVVDYCEGLPHGPERFRGPGRVRQDACRERLGRILGVVLPVEGWSQVVPAAVVC